MTQGTNNPVVAKNATTQNNQEWWVEELEDLLMSHAWSLKDVFRLASKVSRQSREEALKECLDAVNMLAPLDRHGRKFRFRHNSERGTFSVEFA